MQRILGHFLLVLLILASVHVVRVSGPVRAGDKKGDDIVDAVDLTKLYAENPAEFDKKYKGKTIIVEGMTGSTGVKAGKATFLMIGGYSKPGQGYSHEVRCEQSTPDFEGIRNGHKVRIQGTCQGHSDTSVAAELRDCKVIKVFADDYPPSKATKAEVKKLQGKWTVTSAESGGKKLEPKQAFEAVSFEGYTAYLHQGDKLLSFGVAANPEKTPKTIDLVGGKTLPCIYTLDGDKLRLALPALNKDGTFTRPTDFDTKSGSLVLEAERAK